MSFPQTTPLRPVPGAFLNTPAVASRYQSNQDPVRRQLFPVSESSQSLPSSGSKTLVHSASAPQVGAAGAGIQESTSALAATNLQPVPILRSENVPPVVKAAKAINAFLQADESFPDLDSYCRRE